MGDIQSVRKVFTLQFSHILICYTLVPEWIQFIFAVKILQKILHDDNLKKDLQHLSIIYCELKSVAIKSTSVFITFYIFVCCTLILRWVKFIHTLKILHKISHDGV